ncbi:MAG TPA: M48 family metallopeptidase [Kiritimatiellia bacterium]|nr:M48 family metallopeptidase [Kiritimatiellia bacterium]HRU70382.1 M48 family metallopeptidase [Kiritimatiellia bacterium]
MTFFARQEAARRKTRVLLVYYAAAVVLIVCAFYLASRAIAALVAGSVRDESPEISHYGHVGIQVFAWDPLWLLVTAGVSAVVIGGGTLYRRTSLAEGGAAVARSAGGREIVPGHAGGFLERRLLNIVEEVALASGVPVPRVFVLEDEPGINAFAAGFSLHDAAVAVTRGALERLSRDELHGVVAHEFSHIKNGDMRLNSWLLGVLFGILVTSILGRHLMLALRYMRVSGNRKNNGGGIVLIAFLSGLALWVIGSAGVFFARLIQASVSRQREFLADASAVQFTRNPAGLAGALKRIGASSAGSSLRCANRHELAHLLFSPGASLGRLFASHPPLLVRIRQLDPGFEGDFAPWRAVPREAAPDAAAASAASGVAALHPSDVSAEEIPAVIRLLPALEPGLREALTRPDGAPAALYGLLLSEDAQVRQRQHSLIAAAETTALATAAERWRDAMHGMGRIARRQVLDLAVAGVRQRAPGGQAACLTLARELADADRERSLFEALLLGRMQRALRPAGAVRGFYGRPLPPARVQAEAATVLAVMAYLGQPHDDSAAEAAWRQGVVRATSFGVGRLPMPPRRVCTLSDWDAAVQRLDGLAPLFKGELLTACSFVMRADGALTEDETELLRALADLLDMPLPDGNRFQAA